MRLDPDLRPWNFYDGQLTLGLVPVEYRQMRIENLCDGADFAHKLGITDVVTHMGFIPENPYDPNFSSFCIAVRTVAEHLKKNGQCLLFETGQETPVTMLRCFEAVGTDNLYVNLDTANLILYGKAKSRQTHLTFSANTSATCMQRTAAIRQTDMSSVPKHPLDREK